MRPFGIRAAAASMTAAALLSACSASEPGSVTGIVHIYGGPSSPTDGKPVNTGQPAPGQLVTVVAADGTKIEATSDARGAYKVSLPPGDYTLRCSKSRKFAVRSGQTTSLDCELAVA